MQQSFAFKTLRGRVVLPNAYDHDPIAIFSDNDGDVLVRFADPYLSLQRLTPPHTVTELFCDFLFYPLFVYDDRVLVAMREVVNASSSSSQVTLCDIRTGKPLTAGGAPVALEETDVEDSFWTAVPQPDPNLVVLRTGPLGSVQAPGGASVAVPGPIEDDDDDDDDDDRRRQWRDHFIDISGSGARVYSEPSATRVIRVCGNARCAFSPSGRVLVSVEQSSRRSVSLSAYDAFIARGDYGFSGNVFFHDMTLSLDGDEVVAVRFLAEDIVLIATEAEAVAVHLALAKVVATIRMASPEEDAVAAFVCSERWVARTVSDGMHMHTIVVAPTASFLGNLLPPEQ